MQRRGIICYDGNLNIFQTLYYMVIEVNNVTSNLEDMPENFGTTAMAVKGAQSVYRTLNILKLVIQQGSSRISLKDISDQLGIPASTVHRLLAVLKECGFVSFDTSDKKYFIGEECIAWMQFDRDSMIKSKYSKLIHHIAQQFGYTTYLYARKGYDCVCLDRVQGTRSIQVFTCNPGDRKPLGLGTGTLAMIAFLEEDEIESILRHNESQLRQGMLCSLDDLRAFIQQSRKLGYGYGHDIILRDAVGISFPIQVNREVVGSVALDSLKGSEWDDQFDIMVDYIRANIQ